MDEKSIELTKLAIERTLYAAERTLSAWIRTGLASVGAGFAIVRFLVFQDIHHRIIADVIGEVLIISGMGIMMFALHDYRTNLGKLGACVSKMHERWITAMIAIFVIVSLFLLYITIHSYISTSST